MAGLACKLRLRKTRRLRTHTLTILALKVAAKKKGARTRRLLSSAVRRPCVSPVLPRYHKTASGQAAKSAAAGTSTLARPIAVARAAMAHAPGVPGVHVRLALWATALCGSVLGVHIADNGDGTFTNPVMPNAHWSDPAVLRKGKERAPAAR